MASSSEVDLADCFSVSGPVHMMVKNAAGSASRLVDIDWYKEDHRRCVAACLVKGVYMLEDDINQRRVHTNNQLAPPWWESFGFRRVKEIKDDHNGVDKFIIGAIYEHVSPHSEPAHPARGMW
uniref:Uncharacterized protein n=1 Tax=Oryza brachyantha TaxID=4533 RepID=J3MLH8_ORYBR